MHERVSLSVFAFPLWGCMYIGTCLQSSGSSVQFSHSVVSFCDTMDWSTPGFPVHHHLPELAQTHGHRVGDAIQPSHPLSSSSAPAFNLPSIRVFSMTQFFASDGQSIGASIAVLPMNIQDWFPLGLTGWSSLQSKELLRVFSNTTAQKHQFFGAQLSLEYNSHIHSWLLEKLQLWLHRPLLAK